MKIEHYIYTWKLKNHHQTLGFKANSLRDAKAEFLDAIGANKKGYEHKIKVISEWEFLGERPIPLKHF